MGVFRRAGRVLYRFGLEAGVAGRVLFRFGFEAGVAGRVLFRGVCAAWLVGGGLREKVLPARVVCVWTGIFFSLLALNGLKWAFFAVWGEFCTGLALRRGLLGEFCSGCGLEVGVAGRVLYRGVCAAWLVGGGLREKVLPARVVCVWTGIFFSLLASNGPKWAFFAVLGEFCTGCGFEVGVAGRVLYRGVCAAWLVGGGLREKVLPARVVCVPAVIVFSLLASNGLK